MVDLATDINVILVYFGEAGQEGYGWIMLGMVLASMGLQLVVVMIQNGKAGWGKLLQEMLLVVSGLKPGKRERRSECGVERGAQLIRSRRCRRHAGRLERGNGRASFAGCSVGAGVDEGVRDVLRIDTR
jgi:hypothetical protein